MYSFAGHPVFFKTSWSRKKCRWRALIALRCNYSNCLCSKWWQLFLCRWFFSGWFVGVEFHRSKFIWKKEGLHSSGKLNSLNHLRIKLRICKENVCVWVKQLIQRRKQTIEKKDQKPYFLWHEDDKGLEGGQRWYDNWNLLDMILMRCKILWLDIWVVTGHSCQFNLVDKSNLTLIFDTQKTIGVQKMLVQNNYPPRNILDQKTFLLIKIKIMTPKILGK